MKTLVLIRHAKSSWENGHSSDYERPLNERGRNSLPIMANAISKLNYRKMSFLSSSATRAKQTAIGICAELGYDINEIGFEKNLYHSSPETMLSFINKVSNNFETLFLFAHNPGITEAVDYFSEHYIDNMPTCGLVQINFEIDDWALVSKGLGSFVLFDYPKNYQ